MDEVMRRLNENGVRYLLIGGQAMRLHGMPRFFMCLTSLGGAALVDLTHALR